MIDVQLRVMEVDEMQLGDGAEKDRRTILVEPGTGGDRESFQVFGGLDVQQLHPNLGWRLKRLMLVEGGVGLGNPAYMTETL